MTAPRSIVITGASRGLGAALATSYAGPGRVLGLTAFGSPLLSDVARTCEERGAQVRHAWIDAASAQDMRTFIRAVDAERAVDLVIVNAGRFSGNPAPGTLQPLQDGLDLLRSNLVGAITTVEAAVDVMRPRRRGHIVLIVSLAALYPQADAPIYTASKAGLAAYGEAMREWLAGDGIRVSLVFPGHIATDQTERQVGRLPLMLSAAAATRRIKAGLDRGRDTIVFPRRLYWMVRAGNLLPAPLRYRTNRPFRFHVRKENNTT
ncbi:MAG: SDR family NAD(P)-dependent oxidoreductase [Hyphomicrobiaceae bacterium]